TLDDIAWVFNLRGKDVECNPVFYAFAVISTDVAWLFIEPAKVPAELKRRLNEAGIILKNYTDIQPFLSELPAGKQILLDPSTTNHTLYNALPGDQIVKGENIIRNLKAIKNPVEIGHIRHAMIKDGIALTRLFRWLFQTLETRTVPETEVAEKLIAFRREQGDYHGESFDAICGYNANGAIVHYHAEPDTCAHIQKQGILLLDSGGQYTDGTTDITRTIALDTPTAEQKKHFTLVLKGHIGLTLAKFPETTSGVQLDTLARIFLWKNNLNYGHGTGHGVGFFLNVHEPPQGFATNPGTSRGTTYIVPGMLTSNEPGYYKEGAYGIRIENLILCVEDAPVNGERWFRFESLTLFPIDLNLVEAGLLSEEEKEWLNAYHRDVFEKLSPHLTKEETEWLKNQCRPI
ncbi:MAG: aminopeptidase P family protein, partial [Bacteroidetes bacterium]